MLSDMSNPKSILKLYTDVLYGDVVSHCIKDLDIAERISNMAGVYSQGFGPIKVIDYNGILNRCAYLHKYAPVYTAIVCSTMRRILSEETTVKFRLESGVFKMCSLGGGPGTDVIGVLAALDAAVGSGRQWRMSANVVDYMEGWKSTFRSVVKELWSSDFSDRFPEDRFSWKYVQGDLLDIKKYEVWDLVTYSSLVTIVKCLSTFRSEDVPRTIRKIFRAMSVGSFILIIDDLAEELTDIILTIADNHQLIPIFGPLRNASYSFEELRVTRFGQSSCHQAVVTSLLLIKPLFNPKSFITTKFQPPTPEFCAKCWEMPFLCPKCSVLKNFRDYFYLFIRNISYASNTFRESESSTPVESLSTSPTKSGSAEKTSCIEIAKDEN